MPCKPFTKEKNDKEHHTIASDIKAVVNVGGVRECVKFVQNECL